MISPTNWKVNERAYPRLLGPKISGRIVEFTTYKSINTPVRQWDKYYPRWRESLVAILEYDDVSLPFTREECELINEDYDKAIQKCVPVKRVSVPIDDLVFLSNGTIAKE